MMEKSEKQRGAKSPSERTTIILAAPGPEDGAGFRVEFGARSDTGKVRRNNEDQYLVVRTTKAIEILGSTLAEEQYPPVMDRDGYTFLVADGMGGPAAGEVASTIVVQEALKHMMETAKWFFKLDDPDEQVRLRLLRETLARMDRRLIEAGEANPTLAGMGTTLTAATLVGANLFIVHVGDSRVYLLRDRHLEQLTKDHTVTQALLDRGLIEPEEAPRHPYRNIITNVIGGRPGVEGQMLKLRLLTGDRLLLCTDGLSSAVSDGQIADILLQNPDPADSVDALVDAALHAGGRDNITVIVVNCLPPS